MTDGELYLLLKEKSDKAFRLFFYHYHDFFFRVAIYYVRKEDDAQEVVLNAFMKLWKLPADSVDAIQNLKNYCFILVKNESLTFLSRCHEQGDVLEDGLHTADRSTPESELLHDELLQVYAEAIDQLPARCKEVYINIKEKNKSYAEVAEEMGVSLKTIDNQLQKAVKSIKELINQYLSGRE